MRYLFDNMLVSSPNGGGLFLLQRDMVLSLDGFATTGLSLAGGKLVRGVQPASLVVYDTTTSEINKDVTPFHDVHDVLVDGDYLYIVATTGNEIIKLTSAGVEVKRWIFPGEKDSLHINSLARWNGRIVFSAFGNFKSHRAYKGKTVGAGFVRDLYTDEDIITGLSQPHSLVPCGQNIILANSEQMEIAEYDASGKLLRSKSLNGYTRGISIVDGKLYVGLSRSRNISEHSNISAAVVVLDGNSWEELGRLKLPAAEIYALQWVDNPKTMSRLLTRIRTYAAEKTASLRWKAALPLREARRWRNSPVLQVKQYILFVFSGVIAVVNYFRKPPQQVTHTIYNAAEPSVYLHYRRA